MTVLKVDAESLARTRFALSPMAETLGALLLLASGQRDPWRADWIDEHRTTVTSMAAVDPVLGELIRVLPRTRWLPDFLTPPPVGMNTNFADELAAVAAAPAARVRADLALAAGGCLPPALDRADLGERVCQAFAKVWAQCLESDWQRRKAVLERDVVQRAGLLAAYGWARALQGLSSSIRWRGDGHIEVNSIDYPEQAVGQATLILVPSSFAMGWLCLDPPRAYTVVYPARGTASVSETETSHGVEKLVGATRARVLGSLEVPATTSQLTAQLGLSLATVSEHLTVLRDAGIVGKVRSGRSVLYRRTPLGDALIIGLR